MLPLNQRIAFALFALITVVLGARGFARMVRRIRRGRRDTDQRGGNLPQRAWYALWTTLTQGRVFRRRRVLGVFHSVIVYAFILYLLVNAVDAAEGFVDVGDGSRSWIGVVYRALTDLFSGAAILSILVFVLRRYALPARRDFRFNPRTLLHPDVRRGSINWDSAIVSAFLLLHIGSRIVGNAAKLAIRGPDPAQPVSSMLAHAFAGSHATAWRVFGYWGALGSVLLFLVYFPYSKHIHLLMAPAKYFFRRNASSGELPALEVDLEAAAPELGAATLPELAWPRLLDAYACIQCNRCQDVCPASATGKALSPAALEINKRMVLNTAARETSAFALSGEGAFEAGTSQGPNLLAAVISPEAVWACTTCGACMEVCPTQDEQMLDIIDIRRNLVLQQGEFPSQLQTAFRGMERAKNPWGIAQDKRMAWADGLDVPTVDEVPNPDVLYWVGCAASYDPGAQKTARAVVQLLQEGGVKFAVLGKRETCTGDSARRAGNELLYQDLAGAAIRTLDQVQPRQIIASCPHCVNAIGNEFPQLGGRFPVVHHTEYLATMLDRGQLTPAPSETTVAFHDPCYLGRHRGTYEQPRSILHVLSDDLVEFDRNRSNAFCCGAGGAQFWKEEEPGDERVSDNRFREAQATLASAGDDGSKVLAVGCPFCKSMLQSTSGAGEDTSITIKDVAELLWEGVQRARPAPASAPTKEELFGAVATDETAAAATTSREMREANAHIVARADSATPSLHTPITETSPHGAMSSPVVPGPQSAALGLRKKWMPKTAATPPPQRAIVQPGVTVAEQASALGQDHAPDPLASHARKKWQPKAKVTVPAGIPSEDEPAETQAAAETQASTDYPSQAAAADPSPPAARKKWQPRQKG